jgi:hypothetical protein
VRRRSLLSLIEVAAFSFLLLSYIWTWQDAFPGSRTLVIVLGLSFVLTSNFLLHRERPSALGFRCDNLGSSLRTVVPFTLALAAPLVAIGGIAGTLRPLEIEALVELPGLLFWGFLQQYALQGLVLSRLHDVFRGPATAAAAAAILFALHHLPNPLLTLGTFGAGWVWCRLFQRDPNLLALTFSHVVLSLALSHALSADWTSGMRVGPGYYQ